MKIKYSIMDCTRKENVYRAVLHFDGTKYSKDYTKHEYNCLSRSDIEHELKHEVIKKLTQRIQIVKADRSL